MKQYLLWWCMLFCGSAFAHPMPGSVVELSVLDHIIRGEAKMPLIELGNAVGDQRIAHMSDPFFIAYFTQHIKAVSAGSKWNTQVESISIASDSDQVVGAYQ